MDAPSHKAGPLWHHVAMHSGWRLLLAVAVLSSCKMESDDSPVGAARVLVQAAQRKNCARAFSMFSADRRAAIEAEFARKPPRGMKSAAELYCVPSPRNPYATLDPSSAALSGTDWTVRMEGTDDAGGATLWYLAMVKEDGHWRVRSAAPNL